MTSFSIFLVLWELVGFGVTGLILSIMLVSVLQRRNPLSRFAWMGSHPMPILACAVVLSFLWQFSDSTFSSDYLNFRYFTDSFLAHGPNFYYVGGMYRDYLYGPVSVALLSVFRPLPFDWLLLYRTVLASFNVISGTVLYLWFRGTKGLVASILFLFSPLLTYTLGAGLNDSIMIGLLILGLYFAHVEKFAIAGSLLGLAFLTKQDAAFVVFAVLVWSAFNISHRKFASMAFALGSTVTLISLPFVLSSQDAAAYAYSVFEYPFVLSVNGKGSYVGEANIGFSGIWSALRGLGLGNASIFSLSTPVQLILARVVALIAYGKSAGLEDISFLGFSIFLLGSKYLWNNHFVAFLPLAILALFGLPESRLRTTLSILILAASMLYVILDGYSILKGSYPPSYVVPDVAFFLATSAFFIWGLIRDRPYRLHRRPRLREFTSSIREIRTKVLLVSKLERWGVWGLFHCTVRSLFQGGVFVQERSTFVKRKSWFLITIVEFVIVNGAVWFVAT